MTEETVIAVGTILKSKSGEFTKVIALSNGVYAISGWGNEVNANKATVAQVHVNIFGLLYAEAQEVEPLEVTSEMEEVSTTTNSEEEATEAKEEAPVEEAPAPQEEATEEVTPTEEPAPTETAPEAPSPATTTSKRGVARAK